MRWNSARRTLLSATVPALGVALALSGTVSAAGVGVAPAERHGASVPHRVPAPAPLYPKVGPGTHFVDENAKLAGFNEPAWYKANIPFLDVPDTQIEDVYYYRWRTWKEHLRYTAPASGWVSTEFLDCCGYAAPYQAINGSAPHQIDEGRWVRNRQYLDDYTKFWLTGPGAGPKPAIDGVNADTTDWAHEYGFWLASAAYGRAQVTGDTGKLTAMLPKLEKQWHGWDKQFNPALGLYWSVPVWDAMEYSASSYQSSDPYHGGAGYRPTLNSYQYGDAVAISRIAKLAHQEKVARTYAAKAAALKKNMQAHLWDPKRHFYYHVARDHNPSHAKLDTREEIGFIPWMFDAAEPGDSSAWAEVFDPQGFASAYGPTTAERRSPWFMHDAAGCCRWDGPSWPFSTSQTLTGMANLLDDYPAQPYVTKADYARALHTYAKTQYRNGKPYVAEAHDPDNPNWIYDGYNHSEDYSHSTYNDLVINGLIGLRPSTGKTLTVRPLTPSGWDHFALENVPYHGHNVTVLYDSDGSHYHQGTGMRVYVDGHLASHRDAVGTVRVNVGSSRVTSTPTMVNDAANPLKTGYPKPISSGTFYTTGNHDDAWHALDGKVWFNEVPENTRWTNYLSPDPNDYYGVDFGAPTDVSDVRFYGYDDGGGIQPAASYRLQYRDGAAWRDVPGQRRNSETPVGNGVNRITFPTLRTDAIRLLFDNPPGAWVGVTELQSWRTQGTDVGLSVPGASTDPSVDKPRALKQGKATRVTTVLHNTGAKVERDVRATLLAPPGWSVSPIGRPGVATLRRGASAKLRWSVRPPADAGPGTDSTLTLRVTDAGPYGRSVPSMLRIPVRVAFDLGYYGHSLVDDHFGTDSTSDYRPLQPMPDEVVPTLTAGGGRLTASANSPYFTLLDRGVAAPSGDLAVVVDAADFVGTGTTKEDSLFVGLVADKRNYVGAWYNNHFHSSGLDAEVNGQLRGGTDRMGFGGLTLSRGDRLAFTLHGSVVTVYVQHDAVWLPTAPWVRVGSEDVGSAVDLTDPAVRSRYHVMVGLRADHGRLAVSRFEARSR